jgi:hypothetical protein
MPSRTIVSLFYSVCITLHCFIFEFRDFVHEVGKGVPAESGSEWNELGSSLSALSG